MEGSLFPREARCPAPCTPGPGTQRGARDAARGPGRAECHLDLTQAPGPSGRDGRKLSHRVINLSPLRLLCHVSERTPRVPREREGHVARAQPERQACKRDSRLPGGTEGQTPAPSSLRGRGRGGNGPGRVPQGRAGPRRHQCHSFRRPRLCRC